MQPSGCSCDCPFIRPSVHAFNPAFGGFEKKITKTNRFLELSFLFLYRVATFACSCVRPSTAVLMVRPSVARSPESARTNAGEVCAAMNALEESAGAPYFSMRVDQGASCAGGP